MTTTQNPNTDQNAKADFIAQANYYNDLADQADRMGLPPIVSASHRAVAQGMFTESLKVNA